MSDRHQPEAPAAATAGSVLLVAPQPFFRETGTPLNIHMMCRALTESGYTVHLLTLPYGENVAMPGLVIHRAPRLPMVADMPVGFSVAKLPYNLLIATAMLGMLCRRRFTVVHAIEEAAFYAIPLARLFGIACVTDLDSDLVQQLQEDRSAFASWLARPAVWLRRLALRRCDAVVAVAHQMSEIARSESPETPLFEIRDVPVEGATRPPDPDVMASLRADLGLEHGRLIVYTGNVDRRQGLEALLAAMPEVLRRHPDARLLVVGGHEPGLAVLRAAAERLDVAAAVHLIGRRPILTMPEYMGLADVLISPRLEPHATPLKIFSYMASGRPIVATALPTHTQVLDDETAILVPPTPDGLARGLSAALDQPEAVAKLGARARQRAMTRHTYSHFKRQVAEVYAQVLSQPHVAEDPAVEDAGSIVHG